MWYDEVALPAVERNYSLVYRLPEFPVLQGRDGIKDAYQKGSGSVVMRATAIIEQETKSKSRIVVTEIPYLSNKSAIVEKIADLINAGTLEVRTLRPFGYESDY